MLKKIVSALTGSPEDAPQGVEAEERVLVSVNYSLPWCEVHDQPLRHIERTRPHKGTRELLDRSVSTSDQFTEPNRAQFPHARPTDPWVTRYDYCSVCESTRLNWKTAVATEMKREASAEAKLKKKRHWQDD